MTKEPLEILSFQELATSVVAEKFTLPSIDIEMYHAVKFSRFLIVRKNYYLVS